MPDRRTKVPRVACDAMCGGLARWLRVLGVNASYTPGVADADLIRHALAESRTVLSSDHRLFQRRLLTSGELDGLLLPVGLKLEDQVCLVGDRLRLRPGFPRCTACNGELSPVRRADVGDVVPARSLVWVREFFRCEDCGHVFWEGSHWRRIGTVRERFNR